MNTLDLAKILIKERSISPNDSNCQEIIKKILIEQGFEVQDLPLDQLKTFGQQEQEEKKAGRFALQAILT
tara:strand:- start:362 stop:571 length:210 start_codon:yes stop_codon:yes gene_type:complete